MSHSSLYILQIENWVTAPYKAPERLVPENEEFNGAVSIVRIRSEHAIGFLKGRFHSLKHLCVRITDERSHKCSTYWVAARVGIHAFAMMCEDAERSEDEERAPDPFIAEGLSSSSDTDLNILPAQARGSLSQQRLRAGKARRESLKRSLLRAKERRRVQREGNDSSDEDA